MKAEVYFCDGCGSRVLDMHKAGWYDLSGHGPNLTAPERHYCPSCVVRFPRYDGDGTVTVTDIAVNGPYR